MVNIPQENGRPLPAAEPTILGACWAPREPDERAQQLLVPPSVPVYRGPMQRTSRRRRKPRPLKRPWRYRGLTDAQTNRWIRPLRSLLRALVHRGLE